MKQIRDKVGGLDVHRDNVVACTRVAMPTAASRSPRSGSRPPNPPGELTAFLMDAGVGTVAMERLGFIADVYYAWRPLRRAVAL